LPLHGRGQAYPFTLIGRRSPGVGDQYAGHGEADANPQMPLQLRAPIDGLLRPVHRWVWGDFDRRVRKLLAFAEVETDGGRDILRAAEGTPDPLLRRLYLAHAIDELHHGDLFRERGAALLRARAARVSGPFDGSPLPGGHGPDD